MVLKVIQDDRNVIPKLPELEKEHKQLIDANMNNKSKYRFNPIPSKENLSLSEKRCKDDGELTDEDKQDIERNLREDPNVPS